MAALAFACFGSWMACFGGGETASDPPTVGTVAGAGEQPTTEAASDPRNPRFAVVESLRADLEAQRHPSDGGGKAWLGSAGAPQLTAASSHAFEVVFEVGELGIAEGGAVYLQASPFWGWSSPQTAEENAPGFTEIDTGAHGVELRAEAVDRQLLAIHVEGRALEGGERVRIRFGAGPAGATVDRFAETAERLWLAVDGDGDGVRAVIADSPRVDIRAGAPARLSVIQPSTAKPGQPTRLHIAVLDAFGNAGTRFVGRVRLEPIVESGAIGEGDEAESPGLVLAKALVSGLPSGAVQLEAADSGTKVLEWTPPAAGVLRLRAFAEMPATAGDRDGEEGREVAWRTVMETVSNPLQVASGGVPVYWGDLQNHSNLSDGTALPAELYTYARDVAGLDVMSVTDHDHWGMAFLDADAEAWASIQSVTEDFHDPGRFVTVRGYEWTNWIHGHRHVLAFDDGPLPIRSSVDPAFDHPEELWASLRGRAAITIAHHSAGGPIATDWSIPPDPELEPVTEVVSVHGSSEAADAPRLIHQPVEGNFVRGAALGRGYRLGLLGSSDGHDGHPGLAHLASGSGGLAAIQADELTRDGIYRALKERRVYATSGPRILLRAVYGGYRMGAEVPIDDHGAALAGPNRAVEGLPPDHLFVQAFAVEAIERIDVVRSGELHLTIPCARAEEEALDCTLLLPIEGLRSAEWLYVRVVQADGHVALSSPFFFVG